MPLTPARTLRTFKYAMYFDGVDDYVLVANNPSLNPPQGTWILWHVLRPSDRRYRGVIAKYGYDPSVGGATGWDFYVDPWNNYIFYFRHPQYVYIADRLPPFNVFSFYALANDGSVSRLYRDGVLIASSSMAFPAPTPRNIYIGTRMPGDLQGYHMIAQILFYSRALTDQEIQWNYQYPDNPVRDGLVLWLQADPNYVKDTDGDGVLEWVDLSGYNNHGKIYGARLVELVKTPVRVLKPVRVSRPAR